jgi:50S ribosomal protein L16 3-hydroxylase
MYQLTLNVYTPAGIKTLTTDEFIKQYWQKKPALIKAGFAHFNDPISPEELAGLAMEECIDSRIVTNQKNEWQAHHGPFDDFELLTPDHSTLLVQAVDHWHPMAGELMQPFRFIPNWRIDDLMVSYSTPKGGVGPHLDQYDVFIIQGQGKRHWRVGLSQQQLEETAPCNDLRQITGFEASIDHILEPGDMLYIPPGCPHEGYAVENSINYSVGFRAPNQRELLSSFSDYLIDNDAANTRYGDQHLKQRACTGELLSCEVNDIKTLMLDALNHQSDFNNWILQNLSDAKHELDLAPPADYIDETTVCELINTGTPFNRLGGLRCFYLKTDNNIQFAINGEVITLDMNCLSWVEILTQNLAIPAYLLKKHLNCSHFIKNFTNLINKGYWFI